MDRDRPRRHPLDARQGRVAARQHHLGQAPELMPVWNLDGTVTMTRTSAPQLRSRTDHQLRVLAEALEREMAQAAAATDYERASRLRDDLQAVRADQVRRANGDAAAGS